MSTKVITTFSIDGYELYGHKMIQTWLKYWPDNFTLTVYTEGYKLKEKDPRLFEIDINNACPSLKLFKENSLNLINPNDSKTKSRISKTIRWSHKVYAMSHALHENCNYLIFLDGDTYTKDKVSPTIAKDLVQDHLFAVHFETIQGGTHFETGLISFNLKHNQMKILLEELQKGYDTGDIHNLHKPWDGFWFAHLHQTYKLDVLDLAKNHRGIFANPLVNYILAHDAGKDKFHNSSIQYDKYSGRKKQ